MESTGIFRGKKVRYRIKGKGRTIVLLHGFLESMDIWNVFSDDLSDHFSVVCIDLPGFGKSEVFESIHTMDLMADIVNKVLNALEVKKCVMVGHSLGGYVALSFAEKYAGKLKGLVLFHSHALADTPEGKMNRDRLINIVESGHTDFIKEFIPGLFAPENREKFAKKIGKLRSAASKTPVEGITAALEGMKRRTDKRDVLENAGFPVLFIAGKKDSRIPLDLLLDQVVKPGHAEMLLLANVGHMGFIESRKHTLKAIKGFAGRIW
ncbi:MAG: alpha/beta hydrolase [Bacteroidales bacterium]